MELGSIVQFLENRTILVTGGTGFLAKIFVEKILRVQPNVKKLYLLLRAADSMSALQRLNYEIVAKDLFRVLREKWGTDLQTLISQKVTPVAGDIACEDLGVKDTNLLQGMWREVDVVVNLAATTKFDERYDFALDVNTFGAKHVFNFSRKCANIKLLLHVSTAYVSGEKPGVIHETPLKMGESLNGTNGLNIETEKKVVEERLAELKAEKATDGAVTLAMKDLGIQRARKYGWPNTYVFTKAMGEMLLGQLKDDMPLVIHRPTIITSTYREPFPGWVEGIRTMDSIVVSYAKGRLTYFLGDPEAILDLIPADMVVNAMLAAILAHANQPCEIIYHVGSSVSNPVRFTHIQDYCHDYFTKHPWINRNGKPVKVSKITMFNSMDSFRRYMAIRYSLPLNGLKYANIALCHLFNGMYSDLRRKIKNVFRLVELYKPYLFFKTNYDDMNTEKLRRAAREIGLEAGMVNFDPKTIDWEDYFMNTHLPGAVKYVYK